MRAYREGMTATQHKEGANMVTVGELAKVLGKTASYLIHTRSGVCMFPVVIMDARKVYGRLDYQVMPLGGSGLMWIDSNAVKL
jgi:hypothetical protein